MSKKVYSNMIYGFDIETTTYNHITSHYLSNFQYVDFNLKSENITTILQNISDPIYCRSAADVNNFLVNLNEQMKEQEKYVIIYIQNLAYEFDFLIKNVDFIKNNFSNEESLFIKSRIPLIIRLEHIELRCSYKLLNKSIAQLGENLGFEKLAIDYKKQYFYFSDLPFEEYDYNKRDVQIMLVSILKECSRWKYINTVNDIPLTSTGFTRKNNIFINSNKAKNIWAGMCSYQKKLDIDYIKFIEEVFSGGYNHANAYLTGIPLSNVFSIDIVSSYIDSILHREYPRYFKEYKGQHKLTYLNFCIRKNQCDYMHCINNYFSPFPNSFLTKIKMVNVKVKTLKNNNLIVPISYNKCTDVRGCVLDNGRIVKASELIISCNEVDLFIFQQFYDFDIEDCYKLYYTTYRKILPEFVTKSVRTYLNEKSTLKDIIKKIEKNDKITKKDFYNQKSSSYIYDDEEISNILNLDDILHHINVEYSGSKNKLNAQYGINVQKLLTPNITYNIENDEYINNEVEEITTKYFYRDFTVGVYITSYSRLNLFMFALFLINECEDVQLVYSDTDSWKGTGNLFEIKECVKKYNLIVEEVVNNSDDYNIGYFDYEAEYDNFCTLGCKKYIYSIGKEVHSTIAGINKKNTSKALTELYKSFDYDFTTLCDIAFSPCTIYSSSVTQKLVTKYNNDEYCISVVDENGKSGIISGRNIVELVESDYILMDFFKPAIKEYLNYCSDLQDRQIEILPTYIYCKNGKVTYKYINNWKKEIKLLKTYSPIFENSVES